jgi:photosystem II stability/assembly factor-like uncharacterized protein
VPANFQPTSVTFVGPNIGAVIGQAGAPGHCSTAYCTSLAGTSDYGTNWYGVSAPLTGPPDGSTGVGQLRFLNTTYGWAFGPQLYATTDGGANWTRQSTRGMRVTDLETAGNRAFALFATCSGGGAAYGAHCTAFSLYTSLAGSGQWQPVPGPVSGLEPSQTGAGGASASLVLTGGRGYLLAPSGELLSGPLTGGAWSVASEQEQCLPGLPGPGGQPTGALLAADSAELVLVCTSATDSTTGTQTKSVIESSDNGKTWSLGQAADVNGIAASVATQGSSLVVLATDAGLYLSTDSGGTWKLAQASPAGAAAGESGYSYVGMTSAADGIALPADADLHEVFVQRRPDLAGARGQPGLKSPAETRSPRSIRNISSSWPLSYPPRAKSAAIRSAVARPATSRPAGVISASVPRPSAGLGLRTTKPCASSRLMMLVTLVGCTISRCPTSRSGSAPSLLNWSSTSAS